MELNSAPSPAFPSSLGDNYNMEDISVRSVGMEIISSTGGEELTQFISFLLYKSDAADEEES